MLLIHDFSPATRIRVPPAPLALPAAVEREVERLWQAEQQSRGKPLFDGPIVSVVAISPEQVDARLASYRHLVAQRALPGLFEVLRIRPLAVSGVLACPEGLVVGKRAAMVTQDAGAWELVPSGGIDPGVALSGEVVNPVAQLLAELYEEVGIAASSVYGTAPFCLVEDQESHVLDIGIALSTTLAIAQIVELHGHCGSAEYEEVRAVSPQQAGAGGLAAVSAAIASRYPTIMFTKLSG